MLAVARTPDYGSFWASYRFVNYMVDIICRPIRFAGNQRTTYLPVGSKLLWYSQSAIPKALYFEKEWIIIILHFEGHDAEAGPYCISFPIRMLR